MILLTYLEEFACYGIGKSKVADFAPKGKAPEIIIDEEACKKIVPDYHKKAKIGFLLGEDTAADGTEYYTIGNDYLKSLLQAGADLRFLDYDNAYLQVSQCQGLVLPGGFFSFPQNFYLRPPKKLPQKRYFAYEAAFKYAKNIKLPTLGICAGAQIIGALSGLKLYHSVTGESLKQKPHHLPDDKAHQISIKEGSFLHRIMQTDSLTVWVNSRHNESMVESELQDYLHKTDLEVYAVSKKDNIPEAWGNEQKNILCVQWHPENLAAQGNKSMQNIYDWVVEKSVQAQQKQNIKIPPIAAYQR